MSKNGNGWMSERMRKLVAGVAIVLLVVLLAPVLVLYGLWWVLYGVWLRLHFHWKWGRRGKSVIFVYSESPNWQQYIEDNIFPELEPNYLALNWSQRRTWKRHKPLEAKILSYWGGEAEFNPMAIIFVRPWKVKTVRFFQAFKDYKHGKDARLKQCQAELFALTDQARGQRL